MSKKPLLDLYPLASGYILGVYTVDPDFLYFLGDIPEARKLMSKLQKAIQKYHTDWNRDGVYLHGVDLAEAFTDTLAEAVYDEDITDDEKMELLYQMQKRAKHHHSLILLAHAIGTQFYDRQLED